jgi:hypothetical protein
MPATPTPTTSASRPARTGGSWAPPLAAAGLVNYPTEWWHWSFGDRYWAMATGSEAALYGPKELVPGLP